MIVAKSSSPHAEGVGSAEASGRVAAAMAKARAPKPSELLTPASFRNAQVVMQAIGWLAREDKIAIDEESRSKVVSLR